MLSRCWNPYMSAGVPSIEDSNKNWILAISNSRMHQQGNTMKECHQKNIPIHGEYIQYHSMSSNDIQYLIFVYVYIYSIYNFISKSGWRPFREVKYSVGFTWPWGPHWRSSWKADDLRHPWARGLSSPTCDEFWNMLSMSSIVDV